MSTSSKDNYADYIDIIHNDEGKHPLFWWIMEGSSYDTVLNLSPFDFTNITYNLVPYPDPGL
jgi:hypothetical protein